MSLYVRVASVATSLFLGGTAACHPPAQYVEVRTGKETAPYPAPTARALVWTKRRGNPPQTWTIDRTGAVIARDDGVRIAANGKVWAWREAPREIGTKACPRYDDNGNELPADETPPLGSGLRATLERVDGGEAIEIVPVANGEGAQDIRQSVELVATVGPYLFVRDATYVYACGAHGNVGVGFRVWDVERGAVVWDASDEVSSPFVHGPIENDARAQAVGSLAADEDVVAFAENGAIQASLTEILPSYSAGAELRVVLQFTAPTCYACSDGDWSSYSRSSRQTTRSIPQMLRAWTTAPPAIRAFVDAHPDLVVGGWSDALPAGPAASPPSTAVRNGPRSG
jgi:hypothetical protein